MFFFSAFITRFVHRPSDSSTRGTNDLYDLYDLCPRGDLDLSRQIYSRSCMIYSTLVSGWDPHNLHDLPTAALCLVGGTCAVKILRKLLQRPVKN